MTINHLIAAYGYAAVFGLVAIESLGIPLPGETALIAAATYAGVQNAVGNPHHAHLEVWLIFAVGAAAAVIGDTVGYWIGDVGGFRLLRRYGRYVRLDEPKVKVARYLFARHGGKVVFFGRFVSVLRTYAAFLAGTTRMRYFKFLTFNASGGILWAGVYTFAAYYAGSQLNKVSTVVTIVFAVVAVVVIVAGIIVVRRHFDTLQETAEKAFPGSLYAEEGFQDGAGVSEASSSAAAGDGAQAASDGADGGGGDATDKGATAGERGRSGG
ncbi:MAG: DedA family protein [Acidimicrobiales bacterium]